MMYRAGLVCVLKADGKIVRELNNNGTSQVLIPFGSEYSLAFKNNESRRCAVSVSIDGKDVLSGHQLVVEPNSESDLLGALDAGGTVAKNGFKFIEKTDKIRDHRGDKIDDGIIRVEFQFEERLPEVIPTPILQPYPVPYPVPTPRPRWPHYEPWITYGDERRGLLRSKGIGPTKGIGEQMMFNCSVDSAQLGGSQLGDVESIQNLSAEVQNDQGITVAGSHVNQSFGRTWLRTLETTKHVIVFELKGKKSTGKVVKKPVLSRKKVCCDTCGTESVSSSKFCVECGTCLV